MLDRWGALAEPAAPFLFAVAAPPALACPDSMELFVKSGRFTMQNKPVAMQPMFRAMREENDGRPMLGRSGRTLGVRVEGKTRDLPGASDGTVAPASGGMSVALDEL